MYFSEPSCKSYQWLKNTVLPQFIKWAKRNLEDVNHQNICSESLSLVSIDKYYIKYNELKIKYGREMVKVNHCTNMNAFISSYY